ncbi:Tat (twin-arginine translocation) pathway signal sequence [Porphyromonadaceae bacterium KH3CP3RA]|nr:Tat (twin-arginine translocation) pathway signal sequence [Porphyromonadaceae bacterium KH3CP3RA]
MDRRNFLRAVALTGAALTTVKETDAMSILTQSFETANAAKKYDLVAVMGGEPEAMFRKAIAEMGGISNFISKGDKVCVKPNIGWDQPVEMAANTNPKLVEEIIKQCFDAGAAEVTVFDHTCDDWRKSYANSGIEEAAKKAGAKVVPAHQESYYKTVSLPKGKSLKTTKIHQAIVDCDKWINVPVLKNHGGAQLTISMKNYMGIVWDRGFFHANDLQQCIADVCTYPKKPVLNIVDAYRLMKTSGPRGRSLSDVVLSKGLFISQDIVAADTAAANFFNQAREMPLDKVTHISKGEELGIGTMKLDNLNIRRLRI